MILLQASAPLLALALAWLAVGRWAPGLGDRWERIVLAPLFALGFGSLSFFWWRVAGLSSPAFAALWLAAALALTVFPASRGPAAARPARADRLAVAVFVAALPLALLLCVPRLLQQPLGEYDAVAIWNVRALTIWRAEEPLGPLFARLVGSHAHPDYPLLLPAGLAASFSLAGGDNPVTPQAVSVILLLATAGSIWLGLRRLHAGLWAPLAATLFLLTPEVLTWGPAQCADLLVAYLVALAATCLALRLGPGPRPPAWLAGLCLSLLPWAKNEGLLLAAALGGLWILVAAAKGHPLRRDLPGLALGAAPGMVTLVAFKVLWSPHAELPDFVGGALQRAAQAPRWQTVAGAFWSEWNPVSGYAEWGLVWVIVLATGLLGWAATRRSGPDRLFLRGAVAGGLVLWFGVYVGTPADLRWHLDTSLDRLLLQLLPLALIWAYAELPGAPELRSRIDAEG